MCNLNNSSWLELVRAKHKKHPRTKHQGTNRLEAKNSERLELKGYYGWELNTKVYEVKNASVYRCPFGRKSLKLPFRRGKAKRGGNETKSYYQF